MSDTTIYHLFAAIGGLPVLGFLGYMAHRNRSSSEDFGFLCLMSFIVWVFIVCQLAFFVTGVNW